MAQFSSFEQLSQVWAKRSATMLDAFVRPVVEHTEAVYAASQRHVLADIYSKPPDLAGRSFQYEYRTTRGRLGWSWVAPMQYRGKRAGERRYTGRRRLRSLTEKQAKRATKRGQAAQAGKGRPKWRQTGNLRRSERYNIARGSTGAGPVGFVINGAAYALPRHDLGLSPGDKRAYYGSARQSPPKTGGGRNRVAPWRKDAIADEEPNRLERFRKPLWEALTN